MQERKWRGVHRCIEQDPPDHILTTDSRELVGTSRDGPWKEFGETPGRRNEKGRSGTSRDPLEVTGSQGVRGSNPLSSTKKRSGTSGSGSSWKTMTGAEIAD